MRGDLYPGEEWVQSSHAQRVKRSTISEIHSNSAQALHSQSLDSIRESGTHYMGRETPHSKDAKVM